MMTDASPKGRRSAPPKLAQAPLGVDGNGPKRFSVQRKMAIVARLLRGEPLELVARETNVSIARLREWRERALAGAATAERGGRLNKPGGCRPLSYGGMAQFLAVLSILAGVATINWQWSTITGLYQHLSHTETKPQTQASHEMPSAQPKFSGLVPQQQNTGQAPGAAAPNGRTAPAVAQRVVFYEEDPNDQEGRRYVGSAIWRTETVSPASGFEPEPTVRADVEIPERRMTMTWSLRRNTDKTLAASHTIEITFNLPADFPGGGIANIPGILMKQTEQARGTPLDDSPSR